ncbi:hypothetical protein [Serratia fonticola]|uniref:Uncharacterized protein n=1 Tax=Serratia fonticola TaxID=47917 RepID=A0AAW3WLE7_SERFO|nr:hypothetical protein [Serratia fonticola]MBC3211402.1 hypothetical protein [Serratia fonticola]NYA12385.1 hypothetical protein [Serratia fonticola]NYA31964.1 hypothetical protein [Serratia fonticola]
MTIKNIYQLECVPDFRVEGVSEIDYAATYDDAQCKLISVLEAINFLGVAVTNATSKAKFDKDEINSLGGTISSLSEIAIMVNGIAESSNYFLGIKNGSGHDANH